MRIKRILAVLVLCAIAALFCACQRPVRPAPVTKEPANTVNVTGKTTTGTLPPGVTAAAPDKTATQDTMGAQTALPEQDPTNGNPPD
jgi:hypothetical protein